MSTEDEVRKASAQFYAALNHMLAGDAAPLADIWSHSAAVTTLHPIGGREVGWDKVGGTWQQVAKAFSGGQVKLSDQLIQVAGDMAYEVGTEQGQATLGGEQLSIKHRVTNIYRREAGGWRIVHHHSDVSPEMVAVLGRVQQAHA
jgi:ketosteroid isomerase-like protein